MEMRTVGDSGLQVSRLGLGTMTWGRDTSREQSRRLLTTFAEAGGTLLDTAAAYGHGEAERVIGELTHTDVPRSDLVIATKAGFVPRHGQRVVDTSRRALLADLDDSLRRLQTDWIDIWQVHAWGEAPLAETLEAMDQAVRSGKVRYIGLSNFIGWQTARAATWQAAVPGRTPITSAQVEYSLLARRAEVEILPACRDLGLGFFPWSPLGRGVLTGKYRGGTPRDSRGASHFSWFVEPYLEPRSQGVVAAVARAADGLGLTPLEVALLWVRDAPTVTAPLLGARTAEQLAACLRTEEKGPLPAEIVAALDDVSGGPNPGRPG
ncbi:aldo/keto reductase [Granulicoccus phenolivorans]|uniref:aldo/keto reductase n=1 Tax=Granulicoccus phenolivorans TaxID=266854 RepID=UPI0003FDB070|nr:aldo/keto reductase [Granulicoccus phenolivorans]